MIRRIPLYALLLALVATSAGATSYVPMTDEALFDRAELVVAGRILSVAPAPAEVGVFTDYLVQASEILSGWAPGTTLIVRVYGGETADGRVLRIFGAPRLAVSDEVVLFLHERTDGTFGISQYFLGAFKREVAAGMSLAMRDLREARDVTGQGSRLEARHWQRFVRWLRDRGRGVARAADYEISTEADGMASIIDEYVLFEDSGSRLNMRWFDFDGNQNVGYRAHASGQDGLASGGFPEFQRALAAWTNDSGSNIRYVYAGTTSAMGGICGEGNLGCGPDGINAILFNDPRDYIPGVFNCSDGGTLAIGGPYYNNVATLPFGGNQFHPIGEGDIVTQNNMTCFFQVSPSPSEAAEELFGHELGHTLGLGHSQNRQALMWASIHDDGRGAALHGDDRAAIAYLYAPNVTPAPTPPSHLTALLAGLSAQLEWRDNSNDETGFRVYRRIDGGARTALATVAAGVETYTDTTLATGHTYNYWVSAFNDSRESNFSNVATVTTDCDPPEAPTDFAAYPTSASALQATWTDNASAETGYLVEIMTASSGIFETAATLAADATTADLDSLSPDTEFTLRVAAMNGDACLSSFAEARTWTPVDDPTPPAAPDEVLAILGDGRVTITWSDNSANELDFVVERRSSVVIPTPDDFEVVATVPIDNTTATPSVYLTDQEPGRTYEYRVQARGVGGQSDYSDVAIVEIPVVGVECIASTSRACVGDGRFQVDVLWRALNRTASQGRSGSPVGYRELGAISLGFSFFDLEKTELVLKIPDGRPVNDHFWVFFGALSDVEYWVTVTDTETGETAEYYNEQGDICGEADTSALPASATGGQGMEVSSATQGIEAWDSLLIGQETGTCIEDEETLCLLDGRFQVRVTWEDQAGNRGTGEGKTIPDNDESGYFWFFNQENAELAVKMPAGTLSINDRFWFFYGALSDVHYEITVTDTLGGTSRTYVNQQGDFCGVGDTEAF